MPKRYVQLRRSRCVKFGDRTLQGVCVYLAPRCIVFQTFLATLVEDGFSEFFCRLARSLSTLIKARRHEMADIIIDLMDPSEEIVAFLEVEIVLLLRRKPAIVVLTNKAIFLLTFICSRLCRMHHNACPDAWVVVANND